MRSIIRWIFLSCLILFYIMCLSLVMVTRVSSKIILSLQPGRTRVRCGVKMFQVPRAGVFVRDDAYRAVGVNIDILAGSWDLELELLVCEINGNSNGKFIVVVHGLSLASATGHQHLDKNNSLPLRTVVSFSFVSGCIAICQYSKG